MAPDDQYHHGDLPNALRHAAVEVITEKGLGSFSLREVARRAGVSHAAPAHHFGDTRGLLTSLAIEAFSHLKAATEAAAAAEPDPRLRLAAVGRAYVEMGINHPAHCQIMFRDDLLATDQDEYRAVGVAAYSVLEGVLRDLAAEVNPGLDIDLAAKICWATMQGLIVLHGHMSDLDERAGREPLGIDEAVTRFTDQMVDGFSA